MRPLHALVLLAAALASPAAPQSVGPAIAVPGCLPPDPCRRAPRPGEIAIALLGDAGYGPGGASEWGTHAQSEVAKRMEELCPRPDLVFFLGDNIYWRGSPDLFGPRFDTVYPRLVDAEGRRMHAALGNHDVKGCQVVSQPGFGPGETCADALVRLLYEGASRAAAVATPVAPTVVSADVLDRARDVPGADCPPASDAAYEQSPSQGRTCFATQAMRHAAFGYGMRSGSRLRYYTVDREAASGGQTAVRVLVADSNTLDVVGGKLEPSRPGAADARSDRLQLLWIENQLQTAPAGTWTLLAMHHPVFTPRACVIKVFGKCVGAHGDEEGLRGQLWPAFGFGPAEAAAAAAEPAAPPAGARPPDILFAAHNHFYARSHVLGPSGRPDDRPGALRHFVSGGGGAPLYRPLASDGRQAAAGVFHHFVYLRLRGSEAFFWTIDQHRNVRDSGCFRKGESQDRCIVTGTYTSDELVCGPPLTEGQTCPRPAR